MIDNDNDTLRALLLVAIQDDDYDIVRDSLVKYPDRDIQDFLADIRDRESFLSIKDGIPPHRVDESVPGKVARHTKTQGSGSHHTSGHSVPDDAVWVIPPFPHSWKPAFGQKLYNFVCRWRDRANGKNTVKWSAKRLATEFDIDVQVSTPKSKGGKKRSRGDSCPREKQTDTTNPADENC